MRYMQVSGNNRNPGVCSDDSCPCGYPGAEIPRGEGYVYISKEVVEFRADCLTEAEAHLKIQRMSALMNTTIVATSGVFAPVLICEQGARKRGIDLEVAAADARHWWETGQVPLRPTPLAGTKQPNTVLGSSEAREWGPSRIPPMPANQGAGAQPPALPMSEASRLVNVIVDPKPAFADIAASPGWWVPMILIMACSLAYMLAFSSHVGWERFMRQQLESSPKAQSMSAEDRERALEMQIKFGAPIGTVMAVIAPPIGMVVTAGVLLFVFTNMLGAAVKFRQSLAVAAYASVPQVLAMAGGVLVMFLKDPTDFDLKNPAGYNLAFYLDPHTVPAWLFSLAGSIDVFSFWIILLLATGMAAATRKRWTSALSGVLIPWAVWVVGKVALAAVFG